MLMTCSAFSHKQTVGQRKVYIILILYNMAHAGEAPFSFARTAT